METFESSKKLEIRPVSVGFSKMGIWLPFPSARKCGVMCSPLAVWYLCAWTLVLPSEDQGMTGNAKKQWSWCGGLQPRNATLSFLLLRDPPGTFWHPWSQGERDVSAGPQGMFGLSGDILGCHNRSRKVRWHLGGGGQGCARHPQCTGRPPTQRVIRPQMSVALLRTTRPCPRQYGPRLYQPTTGFLVCRKNMAVFQAV